MDKYLTASEISKMYGVSDKHISRTFKNARTESYIFCGRTCKRYNRDDVEAIMNEQKMKKENAQKNYEKRPNVSLGVKSALIHAIDKNLYLKLRNTWYGMMRRCYAKDREEYYKYYRINKIEVCEEWRNDFDSFALWSLKNGVEINLTIDRINNNGNYEPNNCRWVDLKTQANNQSRNVLITYRGESKNIREWADELGIEYNTLYNRIIVRKWSVEKALNTPVNKNLSRKKLS